MEKIKLVCSEPVILAQGPDSRIGGWGSYQFPDIERLEDGSLICFFSNAPDHESAYGSEHGCVVSRDLGKTWERVRENDYPRHGVFLPNGECLRFPSFPSIPMKGLPLPTPLGTTHLGDTVYRIEELPESVCPHTWILNRSTRERPEGENEPVNLHWENMLIRTKGSVLVPPSPRGRLRKTPDGTLWMPHYYLSGIDPETMAWIPYLCNYLFQSKDVGKSWDLLSFLPYYPERFSYPKAETFEGFGENDICQTPDGTLIRLIRTMGHHAKGPSCIVRSKDGGSTWSNPEIFDDHGVYPTLLPLECGVTLASYGRPGVTLRATADPSGAVWDEPLQLVYSEGFAEPSPNSVFVRATCGYTGMVALDDRTAGLVYSDFRVPDGDGIPRKTILFRTISVIL